LPEATGPGWGLAPPLVMIPPGVRATGGGVVDPADLGHPFSSEFLARRQPGGQLVLAVFRGAGGQVPQRLGAHHDALAVGGQHQYPLGRAGAGPACLVEGADVGGGVLGELLDLPFTQRGAGLAGDRLAGVAERAAYRFDRRQTP
jgi:hypothetical protein